MTYTENVNKLGNFTLKRVEIERLQVKLSIIVYSERVYHMFTSLLTSVLYTESGNRNNIDMQLSFRTSLVEQNNY